MVRIWPEFLYDECPVIDTSKIESLFTWLLLSCMILGIALIFIYKSLGGSNFLIGIGGGITLVSALTYCIELLIRFVEGIR